MRCLLLLPRKGGSLFRSFRTAPAGIRYCRFHGEDVYTTKESERLLRLPMYYSLTEENVDEVVTRINEFYRAN